MLGDAWTVLDDWHNTWKRSIEVPGALDESGEFPEALFRVLQSALEVLRLREEGLSKRSFTIQLHDGAMRLFAAVREVREALPSEGSPLNELIAELESLERWLSGSAFFSLGQGKRVRVTTEFATQLRARLAGTILVTGREFLGVTSAPLSIFREYRVLASLVTPGQDQRGASYELTRAQMVEVVSTWYDHWKRQAAEGRDTEKNRQAEILVDLLDALESSQVREEAAAKMVVLQDSSEPVLLESFRAAFRTSPWTQNLRLEDKEMADYHLRVIAQLAVQFQREDLYYARTFQDLAEASGIGNLPAEAQAPLGNWRGVEQVIVLPFWAQEPPPEETSLPPDADELLEAFEEPEAEMSEATAAV